MGKLSDYAKNASKFLKLKDGESMEVVFKAFKIVPNKFDTEKETVKYIFLTDGGQEKEWENGAGYVADFFDGVKEGEPVRITRDGEGTKTKYKLELIIQ